MAAEGRVVAVNYATGSRTNTSQFFAIDHVLAQAVVDELRNGDFESLGINGQTVVDEENGIAGIWVAGVAPGSPASDSKIPPGDIVTSSNGLPIGTDGICKDCWAGTRCGERAGRPARTNRGCASNPAA